MSLTAVELGLLRRAIEVARGAREHGNHPFGSVLADAEGNLLLEAENSVVTGRDCTGHAETNLVRIAFGRFTPEFLARCTLYASTEPCVMCAGAIHWSGIGRVVFALPEAELYAMAGRDESTLRMPCRELFARRERPVCVLGPALAAEARAVHEGFWTPQDQ